TYEDNTVSTGKTYYYFIKAVGADGTATAYSSYKKVSVPSASSGTSTTPEIDSVAYADGKVTVAIKALDGAASYTVYRSTSITGTKTTLGSSTGLTYEDNTVSTGKTYYYFIKAVSADGTASAYSAYKQVSIPSVSTSTKPELESVVYADSQVTVTIKEYTGAASYEVYRSTSITGTKTLLGTTSTSIYVDNTAVTGKKYYYFIKVVTTDGTKTAYSNYIAVSII
ncbi:MAG: hypothetical protein ACI4WS_02985, partial [Oscillospiraceae bacterium]